MGSKPNIVWLIAAVVVLAVILAGLLCWQAPWFCEAVRGAFTGD